MLNPVGIFKVRARLIDVGWTPRRIVPSLPTFLTVVKPDLAELILVRERKVVLALFHIDNHIVMADSKALVVRTSRAVKNSAVPVRKRGASLRVAALRTYLVRSELTLFSVFSDVVATVGPCTLLREVVF